MNTFTKINLDRQNLDLAPEKIRNFISEHGDFFIDRAPDSDYLFFDDIKKMLTYRSITLGDMIFNFEDEWRYHQTQKYALTKEPLAKAIGLIGNKNKLIWDTTCGTGKDALLMAHFGAKVVAFERHPLIYLLLLDASIRFSVPINIIFGDSSRLNLDHLERPDTIFYDPMYPEKKKSALPRLAMQIFKTVVGPDQDGISFFDWAKKTALDRVVIKRSIHAEVINSNITASYEGKSTRYDMYKIF